MEELQELQQEQTLEEQLKQKDGTIQALTGMLSQLVPVVEILLPLIKDRPEIDQQMVLQIEKVTELSKMMIGMYMVKDAKELGLGKEDGTTNTGTTDRAVTE